LLQKERKVLQISGSKSTPFGGVMGEEAVQKIMLMGCYGYAYCTFDV